MPRGRIVSVEGRKGALTRWGKEIREVLSIRHSTDTVKVSRLIADYIRKGFEKHL